MAEGTESVGILFRRDCKEKSLIIIIIIIDGKVIPLQTRCGPEGG